MENAISLIAESLSAKNKIIKPKANSVFEFIDLYQSDDDKVQEVSRVIAEKLGNEIDLFKNKLLPLLKEIEKLTSEKLADSQQATDTSKYRVIEYDMPIVVSNLKQSGLITSDRTPKTLQEESLFIPVPDKLDLNKYLELDTAEASNSLAVITNKYKEEQLFSIWEKYLSNVSSRNNELNVLLTDAVNNIETLLILFTFVYNLNKEKPSNVDADDNKYFGIIKYFKDELANYIAIVEKVFENGRANGKLVVGIADDGYTIRVDEKLYQTFIDQGNSPEVLFGLACSENVLNKELWYFDKIVENKDGLLSIWDKKVKMELYAESIKNVQRHKAIYSILLPEYIKLVPEDLKDILNVNEEQARQKLDYKLATEKDSEIVDTFYMAREVVGYVLFENTGFHKFTHYMIEIEKLNPDFNSCEIANFATVQLLLEYLTEQLTVDNI